MAPGQNTSTYNGNIEKRKFKKFEGEVRLKVLFSLSVKKNDKSNAHSGPKTKGSTLNLEKQC